MIVWVRYKLFKWHQANVLVVSSLLDIRHPEELSLLRKPRDPKKKKKKLEEAEEDDLELEGPLLTPGSGRLLVFKNPKIIKII